MNRAMRERDVAAHPGDLGRSSSRSSTTRPSTASSATPRPSRPSGTARSSARSASAPAAGTPTSRTRSSRSCASSTPRPTTTTAASSAARQQLPLRLWEREPEKIVHWPHGHLARVPARAASPRPAVTRLHRTARQPDHRHRRRPATSAPTRRRSSPPQSWMLLVEDRAATTRSSRSTTGRRSSAPTTWSPSKLFVPVDRPFWLDKDPETGRDVMSMTLTDRMTRGTYLLDHGAGQARPSSASRTPGATTA